MKATPALTDFLNLNIGSATDAYLRELALQYLRTGQLIATTDNVMTVWQRLESIEREQATVAQEHVHLQVERRELERDQAAFNQLKAEMQAQISQVSMQIKAPPGQLVEHRYWVANDGTVTDQQTRLMWMLSALEGTFTFQAAQQATQNLNAKNGFAGHTDWRVPSQDELLSLVVEGDYPSICQEAFPDTPAGWFWTSTPYTENASCAWTIYFGYGGVYVSDQYYFNHVRLVRSLP